MCVVSLFLASCSSDDPWTDWEDPTNPDATGGGTGGSTGGSSSTEVMSFDTLSTFTVDFNTSALSETETIPTDENDTYYNEYVENNFSAKKTTKITFSGTEASISGQISGDTITTNGANVVIKAHSKGTIFEVSGTTTSGSVKIYSEKKFELLLSSASITNPDSAAINIQNGNCFVVLEGDNTLSDGSSAEYKTSGDEDMKAVFFSEDDIRFSGTGSLTVNANNAAGKSGIACDDAIFIRPKTTITIKAGSSAGHGLKANDAIVIKGGVINISTEGKGCKAITCDGYTEVAGGRIVGLTSGGVDASDSSDLSGCAGIKSDSILNITGGELYFKSTGQGGKGISGDQEINISGGKIFIITTGSMYGSSNSSGGMGGRWGTTSSSDNSVSPKGIRGDADINISGGEIFIRTSGTNGEGIESKATLTISGGNVAVSAYDDGFNAATAINIKGGKSFAISTGQCDGIDSNGALNVSGGVLIAVASTLSSEDGLDYESTLSVTGGTAIGFSNGGMGGIGGGMGGSSKTTGKCISTTITGDCGSYIAVTKDSKPVEVLALPRTYSNGKLLIYSSSLSSGTYKLEKGVTPTGGSLWMNYYVGATSVSGGSSSSVTVN